MVKAKQLADGTVSRGELYTLDRVKRLLGLTDSAMRSLRRAGLPVIRFGKRAFVSGRQMIDFLEALSDEKNTSEGCLPESEEKARTTLEMSRDGSLARTDHRHDEPEGSREACRAA